jgi:hypothetical protein
VFAFTRCAGRARAGWAQPTFILGKSGIRRSGLRALACGVV